MIKKMVSIFLLLQISIVSFAANKGAHSEIYISRENGFVGCLAAYKTYIDGKFMGKLGMRGYLKYTITPGHHNVCVTTYEKTYETALNIKPGYAYFLQLGQGVNYTGKDAAVTAIGVVVGAKTGVGFFSPGKVVGQLHLVESKRI